MFFKAESNDPKQSCH